MGHGNQHKHRTHLGEPHSSLRRPHHLLEEDNQSSVEEEEEETNLKKAQTEYVCKGLHLHPRNDGEEVPSSIDVSCWI